MIVLEGTLQYKNFSVLHRDVQWLVKLNIQGSIYV